MNKHPYFTTPAQEQRQKGVEAMKAEASRFLAEVAKRPRTTGRVLEAING